MKKYKFNRKLIKIKCDYCGIDYDKPLTEYNRNLSLNRHSFCSRNCCGSFSNKYCSQNRTHEHLLNYHYRKIVDPYLYYMRIIQRRFKEITITIDDLKDQWTIQNGICPYSGIQLILGSSVKTNVNPIYRASLDRIDSSKGYIKGNIQFVSTCINYMKHTLSHDDTIELCKLISKNYSIL